MVIGSIASGKVRRPSSTLSASLALSCVAEFTADDHPRGNTSNSGKDLFQ